MSSTVRVTIARRLSVFPACIRFALSILL
jgi:hypothetical protein